ncbi:ubiquitinyl hydrolase 1 [Sarracenia purpurea var. burkii]
MINGIYVQNEESIYSKPVITEELGRTTYEISGGDTHGQAFQRKPSATQSEAFSDVTFGNIHMQSDNKMGGTCHLTPSELHMYRLVSVVEHFGRPGSGHYTVYRRVKSEKNGDLIGPPGSDLVQWFSISDTDVQSVSENDVLAAEATVLFYEKISENPEIF